MMRNEIKELTSYKMYKEAQDQYLADINRPLIQSGNNELIITDNNIKIINELYQKLKEAFFCGQSEAAHYLAEFYYNGWLFDKDLIKGDFIIAIGKNCGASNCINRSYKSDNPLPKELKILATECAKTISAAKAKYPSKITVAIKEEANAAIIKCIKGTDIKNIFGTLDDEPQDEANNDNASDNNTELLTQPMTPSSESEPVDKPDKKDNLSLLVQVSKVSLNEQENNTELLNKISKLPPAPEEPNLNQFITHVLTAAPVPPNSMIKAEPLGGEDVEVLGDEGKEKTPCFIKCLIL